MPELDDEDEDASDASSDCDKDSTYQTPDAGSSLRMCQYVLTAAREPVAWNNKQKERIAALEEQNRVSNSKIGSLDAENARLKEALRRSTITTRPANPHHSSSTVPSHMSRKKVPYGFQVRPPSPDRVVARMSRTTGKAQQEQAASHVTKSSEHTTLIQAEHRGLAPADAPKKVTYGFQVRAPTEDKVVLGAHQTQGRIAKRPVASQRAVGSKHHTPIDGLNAVMGAVNKNQAEQAQGNQPKAVPYGFNVCARNDDNLSSDAFPDPAQALEKRVATQERIARVRAKIEERRSKEAASDQMAVVRAMNDDWRARH